MRSRFAILLAIAAVCATTAWAGWTSDSLVTGSPGWWRALASNNAHKVVFGTDGVGHLVWHGAPPSQDYPGVWYNRYNPGSGSQPGYWGADFAIAPLTTKPKVVARSTPCIALDADGRTIHVVWSTRVMNSSTVYPETVCYRACTQDRRGNDKWGAPLPLYSARYVGSAVVACVPSEPNHVLVCWRYLVEIGSGNSMVTKFREYVNGVWTAVVTLDSSYMGPQDLEAIAAAPNGDVFVAYPGYEDGASGQQLFVKTRHNGAWGQAVNVTSGFSSLSCAHCAIEVNPVNGNPHLVFDRWTEVPNGTGMDTFHAVYHTFRNESGVWLTTPEVISEPRRGWSAIGIPRFAPNGCPTMAFVNNGAAHVTWRDSVPFTSRGIMYSYCLSEGGAWSIPEWLTSDYPGSGPFLTVEEPAHAIRMVWQRPGDEIWWKSNYLGGGGGMGRPVALSQSGIELFPNPAKAGRVTVHYVLPHAGPITVTLLDVSGRAVKSQGIAADRSGSVSIDARGLSAGVYVARLVAGDLSVSKSLVVGR